MSLPKTLTAKTLTEFLAVPSNRTKLSEQSKDEIYKHISKNTLFFETCTDINTILYLLEERQLYFNCYRIDKCYIYANHPLKTYILSHPSNRKLSDFKLLYEAFINHCYYNIHEDYFTNGGFNSSLFSLLICNINHPNFEIFNYLLDKHRDFNFKKLNFHVVPKVGSEHLEVDFFIHLTKVKIDEYFETDKYHLEQGINYRTKTLFPKILELLLQNGFDTENELPNRV